MYPSPPKPRRVARALSVVTAAAIIATTGCSALGGGSEDTTRVLQSVAVKVGGNGAISGVDSSAVFLDETTGLSRSETIVYETRDVVADLPVRVSTSYRTDEGVGQDLADLDGYDGRVEIRVELENLTVAPMELQYDAAGQSRTSPALVGTPLSIAASTALADVAPENLTFGDGEASTSGVVSVNETGETVVQWATVLAPPQSRATTAFTLAADVTDFTVPAIDIAVQAGLHTDLSFEGTVVSALDASGTSELGMQQRAISLVTEVNGVLSRAGGTITEVRKDLGETSKTLGVRAAKRLADSTEALGAEMQTLGAQLGSLQKDLGSTVTSTHSAMDSQLTQIVGSMNGLLGDTRGTPPRLVTGNGCVAKVEPGTGSGSLYSTFLQLAGQLNGYADATEQCKGEILAEITATLGPDAPDAAVCAAETDTSMTCSLFGAKQHVLTSMADLVQQGDTIVANLSTPALLNAQAAHGALAADLTQLDTLLGKLENEVGDGATWSALSTLLANAVASANPLDDAHTAAQAALADLQKTPGALGSLPQTLAGRVCDLNDGSNVIDQAQLEMLRGELVGTQCDGVTPQASTPVGGTLESRLDAQRVLWEKVATLTDPTKPQSALSELKATLAELQKRVALEQSQTSGGTSAAQKTIAELRALNDTALGHNTALSTALTDLATRELGLGADIENAFDTVASNAEQAVSADVDQQVRTITERVGRGRDAIEDSYTETVDGLRSTSDTMLRDAKTHIDAQKSALDSGYAKTVAALDERTGQALERIDGSTAASTRDVEAASKMLSDSLNRVILDLGDPAVRGSGILGAMSASAAKSSTADFQLALASQQASGFANVRAEDIAAIMLRQAQFEAALESAATLPAFHLDVPGGASSQTIYAFHIGGGTK
ncbi:flagellar biosynthesis/type III secretory pathway chaperone [Leucobacter komagatae]|uniref:Flagellar biosynthesis/type III secretory pathway chaperone n=1 Tax=Leucobacter komagatae TaxID=55969 RepID=A0A542XY42_9MICO|nr:hypothetical protein [Leucobacter komagatae]TQL40766.1 flagellar biosynthesis/type III secretory pathway chaperone [Leucobacter komagatae]